MELGATVCLRRRPLCFVCPVFRFCTAGQRGDPDNFPRFLRKRTVHRVVDRLWVRNNDSILLHRAPQDSSRLATLFELPQADGIVSSPSPDNLIARKRRAISNEQIRESIYQHHTRFLHVSGNCRNSPISPGYPVAEIDQIAISGPHRRWIRELLDEERKAGLNLQSAVPSSRTDDCCALYLIIRNGMSEQLEHVQAVPQNSDAPRPPNRRSGRQMRTSSPATDCGSRWPVVR